MGSFLHRPSVAQFAFDKTMANGIKMGQVARSNLFRFQQSINPEIAFDESTWILAALS